MNTKKISINTKPMEAPRKASEAAWIEKRTLGNNQEPMKRLTIDLPESLHRAIKSQCATRGTKISDEIRELLLKKYVNHDM